MDPRSKYLSNDTKEIKNLKYHESAHVLTVEVKGQVKILNGMLMIDATGKHLIGYYQVKEHKSCPWKVEIIEIEE